MVKGKARVEQARKNIRKSRRGRKRRVGRDAQVE